LLGHARSHLATLEAEISQYLASGACSISRTRNIDELRQGSEWVFTLEVRAPVPEELSALIGDALHDMRSALDYLVWGLAVREGGDPPLHAREVGFPIRTDRADFFNATNRQIGELPAAARAAIEELQPFHGPPHDLLRWLNELSNVDKHRTLHLAAAAVSSARFYPAGIPGPVTLEDFYSGPVPNSAVVARLRATGPDAVSADLKVGALLDVVVVFADDTGANADVNYLLGRIWRHIDSVVVPRLESFLRPVG